MTFLLTVRSLPARYPVPALTAAALVTVFPSIVRLNTMPLPLLDPAAPDEAMTLVAAIMIAVVSVAVVGLLVI